MGWKDPRTVLFLDFWAERLPTARFVFIFRRPEEVVASLKRRGRDAPLHVYGRLGTLLKRLTGSNFRHGRALRTWSLYNELLLDFAARMPERCAIIELSSLRSGFATLHARIRDDWGAPLDAVDVDSFLAEELLHPEVDNRIAKTCARDHRSRSVLERLRDRAISGEATGVEP